MEDLRDLFTIETLSNFPQTLTVACRIIRVTVCDAVQGDCFAAIRTSQIQIRYPRSIFMPGII